MYKIYTLFIFNIISLAAFGQSAFTKYENMQDVSSMVMDSNMFRLLSQIDFNSTDPETKDYLKLVENIDNVKIFSSSKTSIRQTMKVDVQKYLQVANLEQLITSNEDNQKVQLYAKPSTIPNHVSELLIFLEDTSGASDQDSVLVSISGTIDIKQIFKLAKDLDIPGSSTLQKLSN